MPSNYVLRDLPGIAEFEALVARVEGLPNPSWAPEGDDLQPAADRLSRALFGITEDDTAYAYEDGASDDEYSVSYNRWEENFSFLWADTDDEKAAATFIWEAMGWDVTDACGAELLALVYFDRQIVSAMKGLAGRRPDAAPSDDEIAVNAEGWAKSLARDAKSFHGSKGRNHGPR